MKKKFMLSKLLIVVMISTASLSHATLQNGAINTASNAGLELSEIDKMTSMLKSSDPFVRANAAEALGKIKQSTAVEPLKKITEMYFGTDGEQWNNWWLTTLQSP